MYNFPSTTNKTIICHILNCTWNDFSWPKLVSAGLTIKNITENPIFLIVYTATTIAIKLKIFSKDKNKHEGEKKEKGELRNGCNERERRTGRKR